MPIPRPLLQKTVNYIASVCLYHDDKAGLINLTKSHQRRLAQTLLFVLSNVIDHKINKFAIARSNPKLNDLFTDLVLERIVFPKAGFILYQNGHCFQRSKGQKFHLINLRLNAQANQALMDAASAELNMPSLDEVIEAEMNVKLAKLQITSENKEKVIPLENTDYLPVTPMFTGQRRPITLADFISPEMKTFFGIKPRMYI